MTTSRPTMPDPSEQTTTREQMRESIASLIVRRRPFDDTATAILDTILPQVLTEEQLKALPLGSRLIGRNGATVQTRDGFVRVDCADGRGGTSHRAAVRDFGPLTVVWRPTETA